MWKILSDALSDPVGVPEYKPSWQVQRMEEVPPHKLQLRKICVVKWYDNKPVLKMSAVHEPEDTCQRWNKKLKQHVTISRPSILCEYNSKMGGVDLVDRVTSYYRMSGRTKTWTLRMLMHFTDLALTNTWLLYRKNLTASGTPMKNSMQFLEFSLWPWLSWLSMAMKPLTSQNRKMTQTFSREKRIQWRQYNIVNSEGGLMHICQWWPNWRMQSKRLFLQNSSAVSYMQGISLLTGRSQLLQSLSHIGGQFRTGTMQNCWIWMLIAFRMF